MSTLCVMDRDCSDAVFCNGVERCAPGAAGANARGCVPAIPANPCMPTQTCNEGMARCESPCDTSADVDGDGHLDIVIATGPTRSVVNEVTTAHPGVLLQSATTPGAFAAPADLP
jgi:hypothetical protein